jgi:predicted MPP superfamily phosphohydrolase
MNRIVSMIIFASVFSAVYLLANYYVMYRLWDFFGLVRSFYFYLLVFILSVSFILATLLEMNASNFLTRIFYFLAATWMGILLLLFSFLIIFEIANLFITIPKFYAGVFILGFVAVLTIYSVINAQVIRVKEVEIPIGKELRAVQLSDLHIGSIRSAAFLEGVVEKTNKLEPDVVFITGDLIDGTAPISDEMFLSLNNIKAPVFYVTGNHENYEGLDRVFSVLRKTKIRILRNEKVDFNGIQIIGVDFNLDNNKKYLKSVLSKIEVNKSKPSILLYHAPTNLEEVNSAGINLQLAGHTHNGQILPFKIFSYLVYPYVTGLHEKKARIYVSQGTGTWGPPMRLGSRGEITLLNLK